jgi:D-alanine transaminase
MKRYSYVNGHVVPHEEATVSIEDRGYQFADGVYEVVLVKKGQLIDWCQHYKRLKYSLAGLHIQNTHSSQQLQDIIGALLQQHQLVDAAVYLQITRGVAPRMNGFPSGAVPTTCVVTVSPLKLLPELFYQKGVAVKTCRDLRWKRRDFKTIALLPNVLAKEEATQAGAEEALFIEDNGDVIEGSASNFFWIDDDSRLWTHPANEMILNGITRQVVLKIAKSQGIKVLEKTFRLEQLLEAGKEAFLTSTTKSVLPVTSIDNRYLGQVGPITRALMKDYHDYLDNYRR